ncbi:hypothetical protein BHE74_00058958 [Ensete ventricosum]|nr:hypothetical protein BHE74_00058958 [Ensete ventricosum]
MTFEPSQHGGQKLKVVLPQHVPRGINRDSSHVDHIHLSLRFLHPHELLQRKRPKKKEKADDHRPLHFLPASLDRPCPPRWIYRVRGEASGKACRVKQVVLTAPPSSKCAITSTPALSLSLYRQTMWSDRMRKENYSGDDTVAGLDFTGVTQVVGIQVEEK